MQLSGHSARSRCIIMLIYKFMGNAYIFLFNGAHELFAITYSRSKYPRILTEISLATSSPQNRSNKSL